MVKQMEKYLQKIMSSIDYKNLKNMSKME